MPHADPQYYTRSKNCMRVAPHPWSILKVTRSKLNTKCGRSPRFGRPSRSGDTGCWQNSLVAWKLWCLSRPGSHTSHHHELVNGWGNLSLNKQAVWNNSSPVGKQLFHTHTHTHVQPHQLENQVIKFELSYLGIPSMNPLSRWSTFWKYYYLVAT